jgi:hypothetical protein
VYSKKIEGVNTLGTHDKGYNEKQRQILKKNNIIKD